MLGGGTLQEKSSTLMRYRINWTESVGYYTYVEAESETEALETFEAEPDLTPEPCGFCQVEPDSIAAEADPVLQCRQCHEPVSGRHLSDCGLRDAETDYVFPEDC